MRPDITNFQLHFIKEIMILVITTQHVVMDSWCHLVRRELGRYPISLHILKQVLKYWMRMSRVNGNPVLHVCYLENIDLVNNNKACFLGKIKDMVLNKLGFSESWQNQGSNQPNHLLRQMYLSIALENKCA